MPSQSTPPLKRFQWSLECALYAFVEAITGLLPGAWAFRCGEGMARVAWHLMPRRRKMVLRNLRIALAGEHELPELRIMAKQAFSRAGGNLISGAFTAKLPPSKLKKVLKIENPELIQKPMNEGRGVVLLVPHMGNWELLCRLVHVLPEGAKLGAFYRPLNNEIMDKRVLARRENDGTRMFSKRDPFHQVTGFLRDGGIVGVLADQRIGMNGDLVRFFGRLTRASPLPSLLARRAKSEVLALSLVTEKPGEWKARFLPVEKPPSTANCMKALELAMKREPLDVFWLQERWRIRYAKGFPLGRLLEDECSDQNKRHRALVWLVGVDDAWCLPAIWQHPDVVYEVAIEPGRQMPSWLPKDARVHEANAAMKPAGLVRQIDAMDESACLPLDFVLMVRPNNTLFRACKRLVIPLFLAG